MEQLNIFKRTNDELLQLAEDEIELLKDFCNKYDEGDIKYSIEIAIKLRVFFKTSNRDKSLYQQLLEAFKIKNQLFPDFRGCNSLLTDLKSDDCLHSLLTSYILSYVPDSDDKLIIKPRFEKKPNYLSLIDWWEKAIVIYWSNIKLSRKDVVCLVADKDGGAHVDVSLGEKLSYIKRNLIRSPKIVVNGEIGRRTYYIDSSTLLYSTLRTIAEEASYVINEVITFAQKKSLKHNV